MLHFDKQVYSNDVRTAARIHLFSAFTKQKRQEKTRKVKKQMHSLHVIVHD